MEILKQLESYVPFNEQEERDRSVLLSLLRAGQDLWTRENEVAHLTASAWVVNRNRTKVLMAYHNIFDSWSWLGGHADGQRDLLAVALREIREESGLVGVRPVTGDLFSLEILTVDGHEKRGKYVSSHLHINTTYLVEADDQEPLAVKPDENSAVAWFDREEAVRASSEPWFRTRIYTKLNQKLERQTEQSRP